MSKIELVHSHSAFIAAQKCTDPPPPTKKTFLVLNLLSFDRSILLWSLHDIDVNELHVAGIYSPLYNGIIKKFESNLKELFNKTVCKELGIVLRDLDKKLANNPGIL